MSFKAIYGEACSVLESLPAACCVLGADGRTADSNRAWNNLFGADDTPAAADIFARMLQGVQPCGVSSREYLVRTISKAGTYGTASTELVLNESGETPMLLNLDIRAEKLGFFVCYAADISHVQHSGFLSRDTLHKLESSDLARTFMEGVPLLVEMWSADYTLIDCNNRTLETFGVTKEFFKANYDSFSPEYQPDGRRSNEKMREVVDTVTRDGFHSCEWTHILPGGEPLPLDCHFVRVKHGDEAVIFCYNNDLRETKRTMAEIREANEQAQVLLDSSPISCYIMRAVYDEGGMIVDAQPIDCNKASRRLFGFDSKEEALEGFWNTFNDYHIETDYVSTHVLPNIERALHDGFLQLEYTHRDIRGVEIPSFITLVSLNYKGEDVVAAYCEDLREIKSMFQEIKRAEIAEEESRAKTRFLTRMSHEIRTPLNAILGVSEIQLQKDNHPEETEDALLRIYRSASLLQTIINDILDLSKVETGKMEIVPHPYEFVSLIVDTVQLNMMYIGSKRVEFKLYLDENIPLNILGDELRIKQILNNLLSNAFKYTYEGVVGLSVSMEPSENDDEFILQLVVNDTGQGMTQDQIDSIFDYEFTRFNIKLNYAIEGSGLGMNIAYQLVKMMNGSIWGESELGVGSEFTVRIPQKREGTVSIGRELALGLQNLDNSQLTLRKMSRVIREPLPYGRVLIVDDVESNLFVAKGLLMPYKLSIETVDSGPQAIAKILDGEVYDIVFMDHMMPGMDGIQTTRALREIGYNHPIVALTANVIKGQSDMFMENGFSGFVSKPIDVHTLDECLMRLIRDKHRQNNNPEAMAEAALSLERARELQEPQPAQDDHLSDALIRSFMIDADKSMAVLQPILAALEQDQTPDEATLKLFTVQVHGLKSALLNVRRKELSEHAMNLEIAGRNADTATIKSAAPEFMRGLQLLVDELTAAHAPAPTVKADIDPAALRVQLTSFAAACETYDKRTARNTLNAIDKANCPGDLQDALNELATLLLQGDFEDAAALAKDTAGTL
ncbi:MAG: ATP-binding protein [Defluviitaleaceae bacterium]|nr:ATP-binding protein [Defluviitaleaceae bacterium]